MRVVVVKVAVDRSRRIATAVLRVCVAVLTCRRSKNAVNLSVCALLSLRLRRCPCRRFLHARPCLSVLLRKPAADSLRLVREMRRRGRCCRRSARRKSLQHLSVSACCRGRRCRRGARGKSVVHMSVFAYRRGMCLSGAAQGVAAFVSSLFPFAR